MSHNLFAFLNDPHSKTFWLGWSGLLLWQNYAFTYVSRARNSGSLRAHVLAALQSNGVWFLQSLFVYSAFMKILQGEYGIWTAVVAAFYYTTFTMAGSLFAHWRALHKEKGATAVGANKKYAQIPIEEWERVKAIVSKLQIHVPVVTGDE